MKELMILQQLNAAGMKCDGYKFIGDSFQEWEFIPESGCSMSEAFQILREFDFYDIRLDIPKGDAVTATRTIF